MKLVKELLFNFNSLSHLFMSISKFSIFSGTNALIITYSLGHLFISVAQYFIKYSKLRYKCLSSAFGMAGHTCLVTFAYVLLNRGQTNILNKIFFFSQIGMVCFYLNNLLTQPPMANIKKLAFTILFMFLVAYYILEGFKTHDFSKYATFLIGLVYIDLIVYINLIGSA